MKTSPTLTGDLRRGVETQVLLKLQGDGVLPEDYAALAWDDAMRADVVAALVRHRMFTSSEQQVEKLLEINEAVWKDTKVTEATIRAAGDPPECVVSDGHGLYCVTLFRETGRTLLTFEQNWAAAVFIHGESRTSKGLRLRFAQKHMRLRQGAMCRPTGLRWAVAELGRAFQNRIVQDVRPELDKKKFIGIGQELPLIAALHPIWARSMNGNSIPFVYAPDIEVFSSVSGGFDDVPSLSFYQRSERVQLLTGDVVNWPPCAGSGFLW